MTAPAPPPRPCPACTYDPCVCSRTDETVELELEARAFGLDEPFEVDPGWDA